MKKTLLASILLLTTASASAAWTQHDSEDKMSGTSTAYTFSENVLPEKTLKFPYAKSKSFIAIACNKTDTWAYVGFTSANITGGDIKSGYRLHDIRVKFDDTITTVSTMQPSGSDHLHMFDVSGFINKVSAGTTLLVEVEWYGQGDVIFEHDLTGSTDAINQMKAKCL